MCSMFGDTCLLCLPKFWFIWFLGTPQGTTLSKSVQGAGGLQGLDPEPAALVQREIPETKFVGLATPPSQSRSAWA